MLRSWDTDCKNKSQLNIFSYAVRNCFFKLCSKILTTSFFVAIEATRIIEGTLTGQSEKIEKTCKCKVGNSIVTTPQKQ